MQPFPTAKQVNDGRNHTSSTQLCSSHGGGCTAMSLMMTNFCSNSGCSNCAGLISSLNSSCTSQQIDPYHGQPPEWATQLTQFVALKRGIFNLPSVGFQVANQTAKPLMTLPRISRNITKVIKRNISLRYEKALSWSHPFFLCTVEQPQQPSGHH